MDNFGDIIYVVLLIVAAIVSGIMKKGKKETKTQTNPRPVAQPVDDEDWKDIFKQWEPETVKEPTVTKPTPTQTKTSSNFQKKIESYETVSNVEDLRVRNRFAKNDAEEDLSEVEAIDVTNIAEEIKLSTPEDAKAAFVYSEIFARKY